MDIRLMVERLQIRKKNLNICFCDESIVGLAVNDLHFRKLDILDDDFYGISKTKKSISLNLPMQIGFFDYQYAKLRMLQFYYDFMDKFLDHSDFEYCEMGTDSAYVALSGEIIDALVRPELKTEYDREKYDWFPRDYNKDVIAFDRRLPG